MRTALVVSLVVLAAVVRFWGLRFGLPHTECRPDESVIVSLAGQFWSGDLDPRFFRYPTLLMYATAMAFGPDYVAGRVLGRYPSVEAFREAIIEEAPRFHLMARVLVALFGTATVVVVYRLASEAMGHDTGLVAAFFQSLTYLHVRDSHFGTTDVPLTFFLALATLFVWRSHVRGRGADYAWAGLMAGLAMATKYLGLLVAFPLAVGHLLRRRPPGASALAPAELRKLGLFGLCLIAGFVAATPFALPEWRRLFRDVQTDWDYARSGYWMVFGRAWELHPRVFLWHGLGPPQFLAGAAGLAAFAVRRPRPAAVFLAFPVAYAVLTARDRLVFARYAIPLVPVLCMGAAVLVTAAGERIAGRWPVARARGLVVLAALATVAPSAAAVFLFDRLLARTDTRLLTRAWIESHVAPGESLYQPAERWGTVQLPLSEAAIVHRYPGKDAAERRRVLLGHAQRRGTPGFDDWTLDERGFARNGVPTGDLPRLILVERSPLVAYSGVPAPLAELLAARYVPRRGFLYNVWDPRQVFDQQDAFYLPFAGLGGVERPGPNFELYALRPDPARSGDAGQIALVDPAQRDGGRAPGRPPLGTEAMLPAQGEGIAAGAETEPQLLPRLHVLVRRSGPVGGAEHDVARRDTHDEIRPGGRVHAEHPHGVARDVLVGNRERLTGQDARAR